ncbi:MAG: hypothetical protein WBK75_04960 [Acutalibacteraceae bacterium]|jgi:hypothetical protein|nr:hypothetical protein [Clostridiales bacterium]
MNRLKKLVLASTLAFTMVTTTAIAPMALTFGTSPYKVAAKQYAQDVKTLVKDTGASYEDLTESYPDNAVQNPAAPFEYVDSAVELGVDYLKEITSLTKLFAFGK